MSDNKLLSKGLLMSSKKEKYTAYVYRGITLKGTYENIDPEKTFTMPTHSESTNYSMYVINGALYKEFSLWDNSGNWTALSSMFASGGNTYTYGIKDGKLYSLKSNSITQIGSSDKWTCISTTNVGYTGKYNKYCALGVCDGKLYRIYQTSTTCIDDTVRNWKSLEGGQILDDTSHYVLGLLQDGTLFEINKNGIANTLGTGFSAIGTHGGGYTYGDSNNYGGYVQKTTGQLYRHTKNKTLVLDFNGTTFKSIEPNKYYDRTYGCMVRANGDLAVRNNVYVDSGNWITACGYCRGGYGAAAAIKENSNTLYYYWSGGDLAGSVALPKQPINVYNTTLINNGGVASANKGLCLVICEG